jgi:hypothetical protein
MVMIGTWTLPTKLLILGFVFPSLPAGALVQGNSDIKPSREQTRQA